MSLGSSNSDYTRSRASMERSASNGSRCVNGAGFSKQPRKVQCAQAREMVFRLASCSVSSSKEEADLMNSLRKLRNCIQSSQSAAEVFAKAGAIQMLLKRLEMKFRSQVMLLQILAALGYLVQHSEERAEIFVKENGIDVLVNLLRSEDSSEGILLLGVQVITFVVHESKQRLELLQAKRGIDTMCTVLQRGCVRSALLNERATTLLSSLIDLNPRRGPALCCRLLKRIGQLVSQFDASEECEMLLAGPGEKAAEHTNDQLVTLVQSLGSLLEKQPERCEAVLGSRGANVFFKLMDVNRSTPSLIETVVWTLSHCIENDKKRTLRVEELSASAKLLDVIRFSKTSEGLMCACARGLHHIVIALLEEPEQKIKASEICRELGRIILLSAEEEQGSKAMYATPNAMRVVRQLIKLGGPCFAIFQRVGVLVHIVKLAGHIVKVQQRSKTPDHAETQRKVLAKDNVQQDILQELGLLVEGDYRSALELAELGALQELSTIVRQAKSSNILCSATRALACFVEHAGQDGAVITDIATGVSCDKALLDLITESDNRADVDDEVLLNTVGALGYMVKRQKVENPRRPSSLHTPRTESSSAFSNVSSSASFYHHSNDTDLLARSYTGNLVNLNRKLSRRTSACGALVSILRRKRASESLLWNVTWALIYLMDEGKAEDCVEAVIEAGGFSALKMLMQKEDASPSILNSAARALCALIKVHPERTMELTIQIRMALLSISIRGEIDERVANGEDDVSVGGHDGVNSTILQLSIDPANIADSSMCALDGISGTKLRSKGIRIHYTSKDMDQVGIDAGGLRRDWLSRLSAELFDPKFNLVIWGYNPPDSVQISPEPSFGGALNREEQRQWYRMMGRVLGLSILYQDPLGVALAPPVAKMIFGETPTFEDIKHVSEEYYITFSNLNRKRETDKAAFEEALMSLTFTVNSRRLMMKKAFERNDEQEEESRQKLINSKAKGDPRFSKQVLYKTEFSSIKQVTEALAVAREKKDRDAIICLTTLQNAYLANRARGLDDAFLDSAAIIDKHRRDTAASRKRERSISMVSEPEEPAEEPLTKRFRDSKDTNKGSQGNAASSVGGNCPEANDNRMKGLQRMVSSVVQDQDGDKRSINAENYDLYLKDLTHKLIVVNSEDQIKFIQEGLYEIISKELLRKFLKYDEFAQLIEGDREISICSWKQHTKYRGGEETTEQVKWFWNYVAKLDRKARQKVLQWSTGWRSIGKSGFGHRKFTIELTSVSTEAEDERLPSVATCGFHMWLPKYSSQAQLERKFERAISETAFGNC